MSMAEALDLAAASGWVPVLAHPRELKHSDRTLYALVRAWRDRGLRGMEVYHPSAAGHGYEPLDRMARELGLLVTGGSDFHSPADRRARTGIGVTAAAWTRAEEDIRALREAMAAGPH